jgi:hypothetical protein
MQPQAASVSSSRFLFPCLGVLAILNMGVMSIVVRHEIFSGVGELLIASFVAGYIFSCFLEGKRAHNRA